MGNIFRRFSNCSMIFTVTALWIFLNSLFFQRYLEVVSNQILLTSKIISIIVLIWIIIASFYGSYHVVSFLFSIISIRFGNRVTKDYNHTPKVAILYPCMNDLQEKAILSFLNQGYTNYHIYILDDSTIPEEQERANRLQNRYSEQIVVIRRQNHNSFKAGNLNHALGQIKDSYKYFAVMDADEIIPSNFLRETVAIAESNPKIGFVQASHRQYGKTSYGKKTGDGMDLHWNYFLPARNQFGFVYFYGHGALIRTEACIKAGGFPEIVAEDVGLAVTMRESGYRGYYASNVICQEEVPPSYAAWRKRNGKVVRGTLEFLATMFPAFAKSKNISLVEKLDLMIASSILFLPIPFLIFIFLLHVIMPFFSNDSYSVSSIWFGTSDTGYIHTTMGLFKPLWGWDTLIFTLFTIFAPLCYLVPNFIQSPLKVTRYIWKMNTIHLSETVYVFSETFAWLFTHRAIFCSTGNKSGFSINSLGTYVESIIGILILLCSAFTGSLCLAAVGLSIAIVPLLMNTNLKSQLCTFLVLLPMAFILLTFCLIPLSMLGVTGAFFGVALLHH